MNTCTQFSERIIKLYNILISPDSFKGTLSASEYCEICESAINDAVKDLNLDKNSFNIKSIPLADGGEGTLKSLNGTKRICKSITDCDFNKREAYYGILNDDTVLIEIASCAALPDSVSKNPEITTTFGIGELFNTAYDEGYRKFIFALGGSATNDMGVSDKDSMPGNKKDGEDDISSAEVIISLGTGAITIIFFGTIALIILSAVFVVVYEKRKKEEGVNL